MKSIIKLKTPQDLCLSPPTKPSNKSHSSNFTEQLPDEEGRYELVNGEIMRILATRQHDNIAEFIADTFKSAFRGQDKILSRTFPELVLIAQQVFTA